MDIYVEVHFKIPSPFEQEVLEYRLAESGVESIEEREDLIVAYFKKAEWTRVASEYEEQSPNVSTIENKNWNAIWEESFEPVMIDNFCFVRAPFHEKSSSSEIIDLILEPKMAFGTAHHETTYMMMSEMKNISFLGQCVFDFGCGTAILSILAEKLGAESIYAIDIESNAVENALYNAEINACSKITCEEKILSEVPIDQYDTILANINRKVLLDTASFLIGFLKPGGMLLLSGILLVDENLILETYQKAGFSYISTREKGEWKCMKFTKSIA